MNGEVNHIHINIQSIKSKKAKSHMSILSFWKEKKITVVLKETITLGKK